VLTTEDFGTFEPAGRDTRAADDQHFSGLASRLGDYRGGRTSVMPVSFKLPASGAGE
jgi:hypothetical protein